MVIAYAPVPRATPHVTRLGNSQCANEPRPPNIQDHIDHRSAEISALQEGKPEQAHVIFREAIVAAIEAAKKDRLW